MRYWLFVALHLPQKELACCSSNAMFQASKLRQAHDVLRISSDAEADRAWLERGRVPDLGAAGALDLVHEHPRRQARR